MKDNSLFHFIEHKMIGEEEVDEHNEKIRQMMKDDIDSGLLDDLENELDDDL